MVDLEFGKTFLEAAFFFFTHMSKPISRLKQLREQILKMTGEDVTPKFETLQLHAGTSISPIVS